MNRREFIRTAIATATLMGVGVTGIFEIASKAATNQASGQQVQLPPISSESIQSSIPSSQGTLQTSAAGAQTSAIPSGYVLVAQLSSLSGRTSAYFIHPSNGNSILLSLGGQWRAFSATCTHRVCTLEFQNSELYCPCHGATFSAMDGGVTRGPAQVTLGEYGVITQNGGVYVSNTVIN